MSTTTHANAAAGGATRPAGRAFLAYRRTRAADAQRLVRALRVHGVPTWQDVVDLGPHSTPAQIRQVLVDPTTSSAILWITPDFADSDFVLDVEVPTIVERARKDDGFFVQPVAAGGLDQKTAGEIASRRLGTANLRHWNVMRVDSDPLDDVGAAAVARLVLHRRLAAVVAGTAASVPLGMTLNTRRPVRFDPDQVLQIDWSAHFPTDRFPEPAAWARELEPALAAMAEAVATHGQGRPLRARGVLTLGTATALGYQFRRTAVLPLSWVQHHEGTWTEWSLTATPEDSGVIVTREEEDPSSKVLALLVSAVQPVEAAFGNTRTSLPALRGVLHVAWPGAGYGAVLTPGQGIDIARRVQAALFQARSDWTLRGADVRLFIAAPAGLAVLIGQLLNTVGPVTVHEHVETRNDYAPALTFAGPSR